MSIQREELHHLVDELPEDEVPPALALLRHRKASEPPWPPPWFGAAEGSGTDVAERAKEILRDELGHRS